MVRISKQSERRAKSPRRPRPPSAKKEKAAAAHHGAKGFRAHANALEGNAASQAFIPKIR